MSGPGGGGPNDPGDGGDLGSAETMATPGSAAGAEASTAAASAESSAGASAPAEPRGFRTIGPGGALGRYAVEDELGAGGMATVYRARDPDLRREVAVKVLFPHLAKKRDVVRRFQREARAAAGLEHPHILRVYDVGGGETAGGDPPYIVMELVRGQSLRELIEGDGAAPLGAELAASIGAVLCDALAVAHAAGVVHRDVKPGNVLVAPGGRLLLADFGVARIDDDDSVVTRTGALLGTPSFMSPEQAHGTDVDGRSDLYSVGATLYQLATASLPFAGPTARVVAQIVRGDLTPPLRRAPAMGPDLARAIEALMAVEPAGRPASATAAARLLREVAAAGGADDVEAELARFFADPAAYRAARPAEVCARVVAEARAALAARRLPRALALADRAAALAPDDAAVRALGAEVAAGGRRRRWLAAAGVVAALGGGGAAAFALWPRGAVGPPEVDGGAGLVAGAAGAFDGGLGPPRPGTGADTAILAAIDPHRRPGSDAAVVLPVPDAARRPDARLGRRPRPDASLAPPRRPDAGAADAGAPTPPPPPDARPAPVDAARVIPARVTFAMDAWCDVVVDGVPRGRADRHHAVELPPGRHQLACTQGPGMAAWKDTVDVTAGQALTVNGSLLRPVAVTVDVGGGAGVRIDGVPHARGAVVQLGPGRHKVEVTRGGRVLGADWVSIPRVAACRLRDAPVLDCYQAP